MFDGTLGVVAALEILRRVKESNLELNWPIELVTTSEEEGCFGGMLGAQAIAGDLTPDVILNSHDADGNRLTDAMTAAGLKPLKALDARRTPESMRAWLELHVEQGPVLEQIGKILGVVDTISGVYRRL